MRIPEAEILEVLDFLRENGKEIGERARDEDEWATKVMVQYQMYYDRPEPASFTFLKIAVKEYIEEYGETKDEQGKKEKAEAERA